jgi:hypothetical protein
MGPPSHMRSVIPVIGIPFKREISTSKKQRKYGFRKTGLVCKTRLHKFSSFPLQNSWSTYVMHGSEGNFM